MESKFRTYAILAVFLIGLAFLGIGCIGSDKGESPAANETSATENAGSQSIIVKGSDTILPLAQAESEQFMLENPGKSVTVIGGGSGVGISSLIDGETDIAMASRAMKEDEIQKAKTKGINPVNTTIALDGISVVVNPENPVSKLTFDQLRGIYNGSISNWKEVGGEDRKISVITRDSSSGTYEYFKESVLKGDEYRPDALVQPATGAIVQEVSQNKGSIGYIGAAYVDSSVKALSLDNGNGFVEPNHENILSGKYPLSRVLYFYTKGEPTGLSKEFIDFIVGEEGQEIVSDVGYFPPK